MRHSTVGVNGSLKVTVSAFEYYNVDKEVIFQRVNLVKQNPMAVTREEAQPLLLPRVTAPVC